MVPGFMQGLTWAVPISVYEPGWFLSSPLKGTGPAGLPQTEAFRIEKSSSAENFDGKDRGG